MFGTSIRDEIIYTVKIAQVPRLKRNLVSRKSLAKMLASKEIQNTDSIGSGLVIRLIIINAVSIYRERIPWKKNDTELFKLFIQVFCNINKLIITTQVKQAIQPIIRLIVKPSMDFLFLKSNSKFLCLLNHWQILSILALYQ